MTTQFDNLAFAALTADISSANLKRREQRRRLGADSREYMPTWGAGSQDAGWETGE